MSKETINTNFKIKQKFLYHSSGIYCLTFDRSGDFIITGGDDGIVKIFSILEEKLVKTLTDGTEEEYKQEIETVCKTLDVKEVENLENKMERFSICEIAVNYENTLISGGKYSGMIIVWNLQTGDLIAKLDKHGFPISSLGFSPLTIDSNSYLISTSKDGFMFFWKYEKTSNTFEVEPEFRKTKYDNYRAKNMTHCCSSGGLLIGLIHTFEVESKSPSKPKSKKEDFNQFQSAIRVLSFDDISGPLEVWKTTHNKTHNDCNYSLKFSNSGFRFVSGCDNDSNASVWSFDKANKKWDQIIIDTNKKDNNKVLRVRGKGNVSLESVFVEEIIWSCFDTYVITVLSDISVKVWRSESGELVRHYYKNHEKRIVILESHPIQDNLFLSGGYDGKLFIYDINKGTILKKFECSLKLDNLSTNDEMIPKLKELTTNEINPDVKELKPMLLVSQFSSNGLNIGLADSFGNLTKFSIEKDKEFDLLAQLEQSLERIHGETDEEDDKLESIPIVMPSDEPFLDLIQTKFKSEINLLKRIERQLGRLSQNSDSNKPIDSKTDKSVNNIDIKTPVLKKSTKTTVNKKEIKTIDSKTDESDYILSDNESSDDSDNDNKKTVNKVTNNQSSDMKKGKAMKSCLKAILNAIFANPNSVPFQTVDHILYPTYRKEISNADLSLSSISEDINSEGRYSIMRFRNDMNTVFENAKDFFEDKDEKIFQMAFDLEEFYENQMDTMFGDMWRQSQKKASVKVNKQSDNEMEVDSNVKESESKLVEENTNLETKEVKQIKPNRNVRQFKGKQSLVKSQMKTRKSETLEAKAIALDTKIETNSEKKRKSVSNLSPTNKRGRKSTNKTSILPPVNDLEDEPMISELTNEKTNGQIEDKSRDLSSFGTNLLNNSEPINLNPIPICLIQSSDEEIVDLEEEKESIPSQLSNTSVNGLKTPNYSKSDIQNESKVIKGTPYFCIFCDQTFETKSEASSHYIMHLCPLSCRECDQKFASYDKFKVHNSKHLKAIEWCQHYRDSNVWINNFLVYQQKEDIETFVNKKCIVCQRIQELKPRTNGKTSLVQNVNINHLKEHLKYDPKYKCLICCLNEDEDFYCYNSDEAKEHLISDHNIDEINDPLIHFDSKIPKLEEIIIKYS